MNKNKNNPDNELVLQLAAKFEPKLVRVMSVEERGGVIPFHGTCEHPSTRRLCRCTQASDGRSSGQAAILRIDCVHGTR